MKKQTSPPPSGGSKVWTLHAFADTFALLCVEKPLNAEAARDFAKARGGKTLPSLFIATPLLHYTPRMKLRPRNEEVKL